MPLQDDEGLFYTARLGGKRIGPDEARQRLHHLFLSCQEMNFFHEISRYPSDVLRILNNESIALLGIDAFPLDVWLPFEPPEEEDICAVVELLYQRISKPDFSFDEISYSSEEAQNRFRRDVNNILRQLGDGYRLTAGGQVERTGSKGLELILGAEIPEFDPLNVDSKVREAVSRWKQRQSSPQDRQEAVRLLADVFEWLKKREELSVALDSKDSSDLFNIANNFAIRHHNPQQKGNYDSDIWHRWMFHFYLATYHATIRLILKKAKKEARVERTSNA